MKFSTTPPIREVFLAVSNAAIETNVIKGLPPFPVALDTYLLPHRDAACAPSGSVAPATELTRNWYSPPAAQAFNSPKR